MPTQVTPPPAPTLQQYEPKPPNQPQQQQTQPDVAQEGQKEEGQKEEGKKEYFPPPNQESTPQKQEESQPDTTTPDYSPTSSRGELTQEEIDELNELRSTIDKSRDPTNPNPTPATDEQRQRYEELSNKSPKDADGLKYKQHT